MQSIVPRHRTSTGKAVKRQEFTARLNANCMPVDRELSLHHASHAASQEVAGRIDFNFEGGKEARIHSKTHRKLLQRAREPVS